MEYYFAAGNEQRGPYTLEQLSTLGLTPETLVWHDGLPEWKPASAVPELAALFASRRPVGYPPTAAPTPFATPALAYQSPGSGAGNQSGMAVASLVLGIVGLVTMACHGFGLIPAILAIIFGVSARRQIRQSDAPGYGIATAGLICGWIAVGLVALGVMLIIIVIIVAHR